MAPFRPGRLPRRDRRRRGAADRAGRTTRALGLLPAEEWRTFARTADTARLGAVLDTFVFDAPAPWFDPQAMTEAVESGGQPDTTRIPPPRPDDAGAADAADAGDASADHDGTAKAEGLLGPDGSRDVAALLRAAPDWPSARRILAQLTAAHHDPALPYTLSWEEGLDVAVDGSPAWVSRGQFRRNAS